MGSLAKVSERWMGFQMESAQSPISLAKQLAPHFSYAATTMARSAGGEERRSLPMLGITEGPSSLRPGRGVVWLDFAVGFLCGVESAIEDLYTALGIGFIGVGAVGSESRADFLDVVRDGWLAIEIPSSKLDAHDSLPSLPKGAAEEPVWKPRDSRPLKMASTYAHRSLTLDRSLQSQLRLPGCVQVYNS